MYRTFILVALFGSVTAPTFAQLFHNYTVAPADGIYGYVPMDMGGGNTAYAFDHAFINDSSFVEVTFTAADQSVTNAGSYKLGGPFTHFWHAAKLDDGVLVGGSTVSPMLFKTDNTGAMQWHLGFNNLQGDQGDVVRIVPRGYDFTVYTGQGGTATHDIYRVEGNSGGVAFTSMKIHAAAYMRVFEAIATADPLVQFAAGEGLDDADPSHQKAMLMKTDATGALWFKFYDMGTANNQEVYGIRALADGNYLCSGYYTGSGVTGFEGMLLKVDASGTVIWCRKYSDVSTGLYLDHTYELPSGELLVAGFNASYQGILAKFSASGVPIWTRKYATDRLHAFFTSGSQLRVTGLNALLELDANGEGCDLIAATNLTSTAYTPVVTSIVVTNTAFSPTVTALTYTARTPALAWVQGCSFNGIEETGGSVAALKPYPVPSDGSVLLGAQGSVARSERILVRSITGELVYDGAYSDGIDLSNAPAGMYSMEIPRTHQRIRAIRQ